MNIVLAVLGALLAIWLFAVHLPRAANESLARRWLSQMTVSEYQKFVAISRERDEQFVKQLKRFGMEYGHLLWLMECLKGHPRLIRFCKKEVE